MHETTLCQGIVDIVEKARMQHHFARVTRLRLEIGTLSCVEPEALRRAFDSVAHGTAAQGAMLEIEEPAGTAWCMDCGKSLPLATRGSPCPDCGGWRLMVQTGEEMRIKDMEVA